MRVHIGVALLLSTVLGCGAAVQSGAQPGKAVKVLVAGHAGARYAFDVPHGFGPISSVRVREGVDIAEASAAQPAGIGLSGEHPVAFNTVVVFSDPEGLGVDPSTLDVNRRAELAKLYHGVLGRLDAVIAPAQIVEVGGRTAFRFDLSDVRLPDRPQRSGRHYLILDGAATVAVDCLWLPEKATLLSATCDQVASTLRPAPSGC